MKKLKLAIYLLTLVFALTGCKKDVHVKTISEIKQMNKSQAVLNSSLDTRFLNGTYKLEEGRHIKADDSYVALISKELADKNNLSVGDTIEFITETDIDITDTTFKIIGIFSGTEGMSKSAITPSDIPANLGYIDMNSLSEL